MKPLEWERNAYSDWLNGGNYFDWEQEQKKQIQNGKFAASYLLDDFSAMQMLDRQQELWDRIKRSLRSHVFENLHEQLFCGTPVCVEGKYVEFRDPMLRGTIIQLRIELRKVQQLDMVMMSYEPCVEVFHGNRVEVKVLCQACGSEWHEGKYHPGTCNNCGAPTSWSFK